MEALAVLLLLFIGIPLIVVAYILSTIRNILVRGDEMNRISKSLALTLGGIIGARVARNLLKRVLK